MRNAIIIGILLLSVVGSQAGGAMTSAEKSQLTRIKNTINAAAIASRTPFRVPASRPATCGAADRARRPISRICSSIGTLLI